MVESSAGFEKFFEYPLLGEQLLKQSAGREDPIERSFFSQQAVERAVRSKKPVERSVFGRHPVDESIACESLADRPILGGDVGKSVGEPDRSAFVGHDLGNLIEQSAFADEQADAFGITAFTQDRAIGRSELAESQCRLGRRNSDPKREEDEPFDVHAERVGGATGPVIRSLDGVLPSAYIQHMLNINAVEIGDLVVIRGKKLVLPGLTTDVKTGSVTGLLGPSGCGKTTLIRAIVGIQIIKSGRITVLGGTAGTAQTRSRVGYVTQGSSVYPDLTVRQNLAYFAALAGRDATAIVGVIGDVGLVPDADSLTGNLSGGQRTRVSLAASLLADPDLYLLDEPTVGLDPILRRDLWQLFAGLAANGKSLLVSSHVMDEAARCDRVLLMREGAFVADATPDELRAQTGEDDLEQAFLVLAERQAA